MKKKTNREKLGEWFFFFLWLIGSHFTFLSDKKKNREQKTHYSARRIVHFAVVGLLATIKPIYMQITIIGTDFVWNWKDEIMDMSQEDKRIANNKTLSVKRKQQQDHHRYSETEKIVNVIVVQKLFHFIVIRVQLQRREFSLWEFVIKIYQWKLFHRSLI